MNQNLVHPAYNPPGYSEHPPAAGPSASAPPYGQSTQLYDAGKQPEQAPPPPLAWNDPNVNQYPPAGYPQYPPTTGTGPYGQPMTAPYPPPGYGAPPPQNPQYPQPQQQQQQQVVVVNGGQPHPIIIHQHETFVGQMILACFVLWCCNCLFGLVAFILAAVASNTTVSDPACGRKLGNASWGVSVAGIIISILTVVIVVAVMVTAASRVTHAVASSAAYSSNTCISPYNVGGSCYKYRKYYNRYSNSSCAGYIYSGYCYYN